MKKGTIFFAILLGLALLSGCNSDATESAPPTLTLAPIVSHTPRFTATPIPTRTPLPTATLTPSETTIPPTPSDTPTPSSTPAILGSVNSLQSINVREGPGVNYSAIRALPPAARVEILGRNTDGLWLNIRMDDGSEGWVAADLIRLQPTPTPFPSTTPTPNLTALAQGTELPTALFGGGTITPTPPRSISLGATPTPVIENANPATVEGLQLPNLEAINQTATALAGGGLIPQVTAIGATPNGQPLGGPTGGPLLPPTTPPTPAPGSVSAQQGVDVLAYCDDPGFKLPAPTTLAAGSTIDIFWNWYAKTNAQVQDHLSAATYDVRLDGVVLNYSLYQGNIKPEGAQYVVYWFVPSPPLAAGDHKITYRVTWSRAISDGFQNFGPGTGIPEQTGSCTFTVH